MWRGPLGSGRVPSPERARVEMLRLGWRKAEDENIWRFPGKAATVNDGFVEREPDRALRRAVRIAQPGRRAP